MLLIVCSTAVILVLLWHGWETRTLRKVIAQHTEQSHRWQTMLETFYPGPHSREIGRIYAPSDQETL